MPEYFDRIIRDEEELIQKCEYTLNNPLKRWPDQFGYKWVYCSFLEKTVPSFATGDGARATVPIATSAPGTSQQPGVHAYIAFFRQLIIRALSPLAAEFTETGLSDISFKGHKVSGNAQRIASNIVLHHGTLMLRCPLEAIERYLPVPPNRPGVPHRGFVGGLQELGLDCGMGEIKALIAAEFRRSL